MPRNTETIVIDERNGVVYVGGTGFDLVLLKAMADPDKRVLWRFAREDDLIVARCYNEEEVIWIGEGKTVPIRVGWRK